MKAVRALGLQLGLPRAPKYAAREMDDLTTRAERKAKAVHPDALHIAPPESFWTPLPDAVPGLLVEGTLAPDHHARFLLRIPKAWNGRLVCAAASGVTSERTYDLYLSDYLLKHGYAFAATDKGVRLGMVDDVILIPQGEEYSVRRWAGRLEDLARAAVAECVKARGKRPDFTYAAGLSNGGFVARKAAESPSRLFDAAIEVSGVMWRADAGGLLRELPAMLRVPPAVDAKWAPVVAWYRDTYWDAVLNMFIGDLDPDYTGRPETYDLDSRSVARAAIQTFENTGDLKAPLVSIAGRQDWLIPCRGHAEAYASLVGRAGKSALHELIIVEDAAHIDTNAETFPFVVPLMPRLHAAFAALASRVESEATEPSSRRPR